MGGLFTVRIMIKNMTLSTNHQSIPQLFIFSPVFVQESLPFFFLFSFSLGFVAKHQITLQIVFLSKIVFC